MKNLSKNSLVVSFVYWIVVEKNISNFIIKTESSVNYELVGSAKNTKALNVAVQNKTALRIIFKYII